MKNWLLKRNLTRADVLIVFGIAIVIYIGSLFWNARDINITIHLEGKKTKAVETTDISSVDSVPLAPEAQATEATEETKTETIPTEEYFLSEEAVAAVFAQSDSFEDFRSRIRQHHIQFLIDHQFDRFVSRPTSIYPDMQLWGSGSTFIVSGDFQQQDQLDQHLSSLLSDYAIYFSSGYDDGFEREGIVSPDYQGWSGIFLFYTRKDLTALGYEIVGHRMRVNNDVAYRRFNISTAFDAIGNIIVVNPGKTFSFMGNISYDPETKKRYKNGKVIKEGKVIIEYGGGLCGASTALYQGIMTNKALDISEWRNHSKRGTSLYGATINSKRIQTPGLDATIYDDMQDLFFTNTKDYPIVIALNFDGEAGSEEEVLSLGRADDKGKVSFLRNYTASSGYRCYVWEVNGEEQTSCYKSVM